MSTAWAAELTDVPETRLGRLRLESDLQAARDSAGHVWLRGSDDSLEVFQQVRRLSGARRYRLDAAGRLIPLNRRLPIGPLPALDWRPIRDFVGCDPRQVQYAPPATRKLDLRLVRGGRRERPANLLITAAATFLAWVEAAPAYRLTSLRFAADNAGQILVTGAHLPPLRGRRYVLQDDIAVPSAYRWEPNVPNAIVRQVLRLGGDQLAIADPAGVQRLQRTDLQPLSRSAARLSCGRTRLST